MVMRRVTLPAVTFHMWCVVSINDITQEPFPEPLNIVTKVKLQLQWVN